MPHIHTGPGEHDSSVNVFVVRYENYQPLMMLIMHKKLNSLLPPGGHVEINETVWQAVAHELEEEAGYLLCDLGVLQPKQRMKKVSDIIIHPQPFLVNTHSLPGNHYHSDLDYLLIAKDLPPQPPAEGESTDIRWLTYEQVKSLKDDEIMPNTKDICLYIFEELLTSQAMEVVPASLYSLEKPRQIA